MLNIWNGIKYLIDTLDVEAKAWKHLTHIFACMPAHRGSKSTLKSNGDSGTYWMLIICQAMCWVLYMDYLIFSLWCLFKAITCVMPIGEQTAQKHSKSDSWIHTQHLGAESLLLNVIFYSFQTAKRIGGSNLWEVGRWIYFLLFKLF